MGGGYEARSCEVFRLNTKPDTLLAFLKQEPLTLPENPILLLGFVEMSILDVSLFPRNILYIVYISVCTF